MKKTFIFVLCVLITISAVSCGGNTEELETRITTLESEVASLKEQISSFGDYRISPSYYGKIYGYTNQTWTDFKSWADTNPDIVAAGNWYLSDIVAEGESALKERYDWQISFSNDNTLSFRNEIGNSIKITYELVGNDINVLANDLRKLDMEDPVDYLEGVYRTIGTLSDDQSYITIGYWFTNEGDEVHLYLQ